MLRRFLTVCSVVSHVVNELLHANLVEEIFCGLILSTRFQFPRLAPANNGVAI